MSSSNFNDIINESLNNNEDVNNYIAMDINDVLTILSDKMNNIKLINDELIKKLCLGIVSRCKQHNKMINEWFDEEYHENLKTLKKNNEEYFQMSNDYESKSFVLIEKK